MECQAQEIADAILVRVAGRIDHTTARAFEDTLLPLLDGCSREGKKALLDLGGVPYMSSAGLRVLTLAAKQCWRCNGEIAVATLQPRARNGAQQFVIELIDTGEPFNILTLPSPDLTANLDQRLAGSLGVLFIRALTDNVAYRRGGTRNILQLMVQLPH